MVGEAGLEPAWLAPRDFKSFPRYPLRAKTESEKRRKGLKLRYGGFFLGHRFDRSENVYRVGSDYRIIRPGSVRTQLPNGVCLHDSKITAGSRSAMVKCHVRQKGY